MSLVNTAEEIARKAHQGQMRKWTKVVSQFIVHPERVANKVQSLKGIQDEDVAAAWLHDVLEDCGNHWAAIILDNCGQEVLTLVEELTFPTDVPELKMMSRVEKNKIRFAKLAVISERAKRIKLVDRWDNVCDMECAPFKMKQKYIPESRQLLNLIGYVDLEMASELKDAIDWLKKSCQKGPQRMG